MRCPIDSVSGTSICTCAMCWRFQIGSKSPLANRKARMLSAASLPRKWSIRKIWLSSNVACSVSLSSIALARSVPNGFSMMMREPSASSALPSRSHDRRAPPPAARSGSGAARRRAPSSSSRSRDGRRPSASGPASTGRGTRAARRTSSQSSSGTPWCANSSSAHRARGRGSCSSSSSSSDDAEDPALGQQPGLGEVEQAGQQLAAGQVAGRAEQHDDVRPQRRDEVRTDVGRIRAHARHPRRAVVPG